LADPRIPTAGNITIHEVERIAGLSDPVLRNLQITQCYHELAVIQAERSGRNANWCTFATWASKQAGQTIRKEDLARTLETAPELESAALDAAQALKAVAQRFGLQLKIEDFIQLIWKAYDLQSAFDRSSAAVARGNLKVFQEIAREFARFQAECLSDPVYSSENIDRFNGSLRTGDPPDGQRYLKQAFLHYYTGLFEKDEKSRAELLLLANLEIGFHEQTRLQPEIMEALVAPVITPRDFARNLIKTLRPGGGRLAEVGWVVLRWLGQLTHFDQATEVYVAGAQRQAQFLVTQTMMAIELPQHKLRLGDDLTAGFPAMLRQISNPDLRELLSQIDPTPDSTAESGAEFWGDLSDRIHFIADMFRCYQVSPELFEPPFNEDQTAALKEDRLPEGRL
jgi:hypothetical protein